MIRTTELALASRLKVLSDSLFASVDSIYRENNLPFQARWFPIIYLLHTRGAMAVTEIASELKFTHSAISQMSKKIIKAGLLSTKNDALDERRTLLDLSPAGHELCARMTSVWNDILKSVQALIDRSGFDLMGALESFEREVVLTPLDHLVRERVKARQQNAVTIIEFEPKYAEPFRQLNIEWLEKYFYVEKIDDEVLSTPEAYIIGRGGFIFFAKYGDEIVGTCALIKHAEGFELSKMAVTHKYQGLQIGKKLAQFAIARTRQLGEKSLFLETNSKLLPAVNLYKKLGFESRPHPGGRSHYQRSDVYMVLDLTQGEKS